MLSKKGKTIFKHLGRQQKCRMQLNELKWCIKNVIRLENDVRIGETIIGYNMHMIDI